MFTTVSFVKIQLQRCCRLLKNWKFHNGGVCDNCVWTLVTSCRWIMWSRRRTSFTWSCYLVSTTHATEEPSSRCRM